jgi:hypothetical protein
VRILKPSVGRIVHYVSHGTPIRDDGTQVYPSVCRAAVITAVEESSDMIDLCVFNPEGLFFNHNVPFGSIELQLLGGTWHESERAEN